MMTRDSFWRLISGVLIMQVFIACSSRHEIDRVEWPVMGTIAALQTRDAPPEKSAKIAQLLKEQFSRVVEEFNAFDTNSVINRMGRCTTFGQPCWDFAFKLKEQTAGAFDPCWRGKNKLDFGAVAKGFAVDLAAERVKAHTSLKICDTLIDLGGNLKAVKGDWVVGIKDGETFTLHEGEACATSACYYRGNHIKDARTGEDVTNTIYSVTTIHPSSALIADGLSTVMFILGREKGEAFLKAYYPEVKVVWLDAGF